MRRKKGNLQGRYVSAHLRRAPKNPGEYVAVSAYQEKVEAIPSKTALLAPQGDFEAFWVDNDTLGAAGNSAKLSK